jgi:cytochrome c-type biogenesis protein CcmH/NrfG
LHRTIRAPVNSSSRSSPDAGDGERLGPLADALARRFPGRTDPLFYQATALFLNGRMKEAVAAASRVVAAQPDHARAQNLLGAACATQNEHACAATAFEASLRANPRSERTTRTGVRRSRPPPP